MRSAAPVVPPGAPPVVVLRGRGEQPSLVGGKGWWLDRLVGAGFPVPAAAVVTTDAYRAVTATGPLARLVGELAGARLPAAAEHDRVRRRVDEAFAEAELPAPVAAAIAGAARAARSGAGAPVAARSSATAEDRRGMSFAGQYASFLSLASEADVEAAVRRVWASLWHPAPRAYRRHHGIDESSLAMAVIVMAMVPAETAGVAFTVDPAGERGAVRVETVAGLGEGLVSGRITPTVHLVGRRPGPAAAGGDEHERVAALALQVEAAFGEPVDVEWANDGSRLWVLQARPITALAPPVGDGFDTVPGPACRWTTDGIAEMLPGVLPPLVWDTAGRRQDEAFARLVADLGRWGAGAGPDVFVGRLRGRAALRLDGLDAGAVAAGVVPAGTGPVGAEARPAPRPSLGSQLRVHRLRHRSAIEAEIAMAAVAGVLDAEVALRGLDDGELLRYRWRLVDLLGRLLAAETGTAAVAVAAYDRLLARLAGHLEDGSEAERWAQQVTAGAGAAVRWLPRLARVVDGLLGGDRDLVAALERSATWAEAIGHLAGAPAGRRVLVVVDEALRVAGSVSVPGGPSWDEDPGSAWTALRPVMTTQSSPAVSGAAAWPALADHLRHRPGWRRTRVLTGQLVDVRLLALRRLVDDATELLGRRERAKASVLALGGEVRRTHLEIGRRLEGRGGLDDAAQVDLLGETELGAALAGRVPPGAELARRRRWLAGCEAAGPLPGRFTGRPGAPAAIGGHGDSYRGWRASPGVRRGRARLCERPSDAFERGDVLVARTTDASWSPRFLEAAAVVVEEGGPLSHAAILARELGIPAVVNVPGIVARLARGGRVVVDGDEGTVTVLAPGADEDGAQEDEHAG